LVAALSFGLACGQQVISGGTAAAPAHVIHSVPLANYRAGWCGPAMLAAVLQFHGEKVTGEEIAKQLYLPRHRGSLNLDLLLFARAKGYQVWGGEGTRERVEQAVARNRPVICMVSGEGRGQGPNHFVVVRGYDRAQRIWLVDDGAGAQRAKDTGAFEADWARAGRWMLVIEGRKLTLGAGGEHAKD